MNHDEMKKTLDAVLDDLNGIYITLECLQAGDDELTVMNDAMNRLYEIKESI